MAPTPAAPARPVVSKPVPQTDTPDNMPVLSSSGMTADISPLPASLPSVSAMFDGPKLKDYLPFMKVICTAMFVKA